MAKRELVRDLADQYPVQLLCELVEMGTSSYYYEPRSRDDLALLTEIEEVLLRFPRYGYRRVTAQLRRGGHQVNGIVYDVISNRDLSHKILVPAYGLTR